MITNIGWSCIRARLQYLLKKTGIQQLRSEIEDGSSNDDHNLHHRAAERPRRERGIQQPVQGKLRSMIATETYTTGRSALPKRRHGAGNRGSFHSESPGFIFAGSGLAALRLPAC